MTLSEAQAIAAIASTADGGCSVCVRGLCEKLTERFPEFIWTIGPNPEPEPDWDALDYSDPVDTYLSEIILVTPATVSVAQ